MASGHLDNISHLFPVKQLFFRWTSNANFLFWWCFSCLSRDLEKPRSVDEVLIASLCNNMEEFQPETSQNLKKKNWGHLDPPKRKIPLSIGRKCLIHCWICRCHFFWLHTGTLISWEWSSSSEPGWDGSRKLWLSCFGKTIAWAQIDGLL